MDDNPHQDYSLENAEELLMINASISLSTGSFITSILQGLRQSGFYWRGLGKEQAELLLSNSTAGTFLLRDSSHQMFLFTLSVKTFSGITNIRIAMIDRRFSLETTDHSTKAQSFDNVLQLITFYIKQSKANQGKKRTHQLYIDKPFYRKVCSLQHISRRTIHRNLTGGGLYELPVPDLARSYIANYPFPI